MLPQKYQDFLKLIVYQIYPRSFNDSNNDGIGDINGITQKLDHLQLLGVNAVWICPCYKSPNDDNGYDIADYRDIMDEFGTMDDIKRLIAEMHRRNMKVIMDLVPNHTSTKHRWFQESRKGKDNPYSDYYYWFDEPRNDWGSLFGGTAWEFDEMRGQYYLHSYAVSQADLNWNHPAVVKEMQDVVDFWVDLGVDGFRCDVIDQIDKDWEGDRNCFGPRLHEFIHALFGREKTKHLFTVGECWCDDLEEVKLHSHFSRDELTTLFQFEHTDIGRTEKFTPKPAQLAEVRDILMKWQNRCQDNELIYTLFTDNHDQAQFISRVAHAPDQRYQVATCVATMFFTLRGIPFIYQGQEMGMISPHYDSIDDFDDIESKNKYAELCQTLTAEEALERINFGSRDNTRHPMCWDDSEFGGFSQVKPWIATHSMVKELNLKNDLESEKSVFRFYQALLKTRSTYDALTLGNVSFLSKSEDNSMTVLRQYQDEKVLIVCNFEVAQTIDTGFADGQLLLTNGAAQLNGHYQPFEIGIYRV
mgnify:CR=1 FL=1